MDGRVCACRYGNPSNTQLSELELDVIVEGPGPVEHSWHHAGDHDLCLQLSAKLAGEVISPINAAWQFLANCCGSILLETTLGCKIATI
jgi:hypothetical protein